MTGAAVLAALAVPGLGAGAALLLWPDRRADRRARIRLVAGGPAIAAAEPPPERWHHRLGRLLSMSPAVGQEESRKLAELLARAGFRQPRALATLVAVKTLALLAAAAAACRSLAPLLLDRAGLAAAAMAVVGAALLGWLVPNLLLAWLGKRRSRSIEETLPEALDLLVICAEAGLGLDQSLERIAGEMAGANPALAEEIATTAAEMRILADRWRALDNLAARIRLRSLQSIVSMLGQTLRYGTPLSQSLRIVAAEMRTARSLALEARAARLPVLLTLPLILFILPSLFLVIAGPAALEIIRLMHK